MGRVLVVDDDEAIRTLVTRLFTKRGFDVVTASDGAQAVEILDEGQFDLLVLDLMLPRLDGIGVLNHLAATPTRPPVILMTAAAPNVVRTVPMEHVRTIITKPFEIEHLMREADDALAGRSSTAQA